jgi:hypothetical protein
LCSRSLLDRHFFFDWLFKGLFGRINCRFLNALFGQFIRNLCRRFLGWRGFFFIWNASRFGERFLDEFLKWFSDWSFNGPLYGQPDLRWPRFARFILEQFIERQIGGLGFWFWREQGRLLGRGC